MSFDLAVLAMSSSADAAAALAMLERCNRARGHVEGDIDSRVTSFCDTLAARFPVDDADSGWAMTPNVGIDHVIMYLSWSPRSGPVIEAIQELAARHDLVLIDLQSDDVYLPGQGSNPRVLRPGRQLSNDHWPQQRTTADDAGGHSLPGPAPGAQAGHGTDEPLPGSLTALSQTGELTQDSGGHAGHPMDPDLDNRTEADSLDDRHGTTDQMEQFSHGQRA